VGHDQVSFLGSRNDYRSLTNSLDAEETVDKSRVTRLLQETMKLADEREMRAFKLPDQQPPKYADSQPFSTFLMNGRNELYPDPFDEFDPFHRFRGKKAFDE
jgi:hypothetical protein